jgi:hypothetical protein
MENEKVFIIPQNTKEMEEMQNNISSVKIDFGNFIISQNTKEYKKNIEMMYKKIYLEKELSVLYQECIILEEKGLPYDEHAKIKIGNIEKNYRPTEGFYGIF